MKLNLRKLVLGAAVALLPQFMNAQVEVITDGADVSILRYDDAGTLKYYHDANNLIIVGSHDLTTDRLYTGVMPFLLPTPPAGKVVTSVSLVLNMNTLHAIGSETVDLYAIPVRDLADPINSDFYVGEQSTDVDPNATLIQKGLVTISSAIGEIKTIEAAETALGIFIQDQYANNSGEGKYVFLRVSASSRFSNYQRVMFDASTGTTPPKIIITFGDADVIPPSISSVNATKIPNKVDVVFNESVEKISAETITNYVLSPGVNVVSATLANDMTTVTLVTEDVAVGTQYTITANGVEDLSGNGSVNTTGSYTGVDYTQYNDASSFQDDQWGTNPPANAFDGDLATRWAASGTDQWMLMSLGEVNEVSSISIAFNPKTGRAYNFSVDVSMDGITFTSALTDTQSVSEDDGTTPAMQQFDFQSSINARFVRINAKGNTDGGGNWNNYNEITLVSNPLSNAKTEKQTLAIYPNPVVNGEFTVSTVGMKSAVEMSIYNVTGKLVSKQSLKASGNKVNVNVDLSQGLYIVKLTDGVIAKTQKITVQ